MKIQIKRKTGNYATPTGTVNSGEPVLGTTTIGGGSTQFDTLYIGGLGNNPSWKKVSMAEFTPAYVEQGESQVNFSIGMYSFWFGTQAQYNNIQTKDANTFYFITE